MRKTICVCDRCGKQIEGSLYGIVINEYETLGDDLPTGTVKTPDAQKELCPDCMKALVSNLAAFMDTEAKPHKRTTKKKKAAAPAATKIDRGKILALHNAEWTVKNIAGEMGCSEQTVYNVLKEATANAGSN